MTNQAPRPEQDDAPGGGAASRSTARRAMAWASLLLLSVAVTAALTWARIPAALMLGPMVSAIALAQIDGQLELRRPIVMAGQALLGCRLGMEISPQLLHDSMLYLPVLAACVLGVMLATIALAITVSRAGWFPESSAVWGLSPGAASAMVLLSELHGSDPRIVAVMQYLRVVMAALAAIAVGAWLGTPEAHAAGPSLPTEVAAWFPPINGIAFAETLGLALLGALAAWASGRAIAILFVPMIGGALVQATGWGELELPAFVMAAAFAVIGWNIGLKFTRASLAASVKLLPRIMATIAAMMAICGLLSVALARLLGSDPLTAYLALSPGGLDSVFVIATSTHVDLPLVLAAQLVRLIVVMILAPPLAQFIVRRNFHGRRPK